MTDIEMLEAQEQANLRGEWKQLLERRIAGEELTDKQKLRLSHLHKILGIQPPLPEYEAMIKELQAKLDAPKHLADAESALKAAAAALEEHNGATKDALQERHKQECVQHDVRAQELNGDMLAKKQRHDQADAAEQSRVDLKGALWQFFDLTDPAVIAAEQAELDKAEARKCFICRTTEQIDDVIRDACRAAGVPLRPIVKLEATINDVDQLRILRDSEKEFVQYPGQGDDFEYISGILTAAMSTVGSQAFKESQFLSEEDWATFSPHFNPSTVNWMRRPGQSQAELDRLVQRLERRQVDEPAGSVADQQHRANSLGCVSVAPVQRPPVAYRRRAVLNEVRSTPATGPSSSARLATEDVGINKQKSE